jgi:O-antigen ligase
MLAGRFPALGLPVYPPAQGVDLWSLQAFWLVALGTLAVLVGASDRWLGLAVAIAGLTIFYRGAALDPTHSVNLALGALLLVGLRQAPDAWHQRIRWLLVGIASFEALYAIQQRLGYDLLWGPVFGGTLIASPQMLGTLGTVNAAAGYLAIVAPLMPLPLIVPVALVIWLSHSLGAIGALAVGLVVRYRAHWSAWVAAALGVAGAAWLFNLRQTTRVARLQIWQFALEHWVRTDPVLGYGLGGWGQQVPALQQRLAFAPTPELWAEAHNEPLQWLVETGLVGLLLLICWLWTHRGMFADPIWGGSVAALAADSLTWFPFHIVSMALLGLIVVALASRPKEPTCAAA